MEPSDGSRCPPLSSGISEFRPDAVPQAPNHQPESRHSRSGLPHELVLARPSPCPHMPDAQSERKLVRFQADTPVMTSTHFGKAASPGEADAHRPLGGGRVHDPASLDDADLATRHQTSSSASGWLVQLVTRLSGGCRDCTSGLVHIDGPRARSPQELEERVLESLVDGRHSAPPARTRAVTNLLPVPFPLFAPLDSTPTRGTGLVWWCHSAILPWSRHRETSAAAMASTNASTSSRVVSKDVIHRTSPVAGFQS